MEWDNEINVHGQIDIVGNGTRGIMAKGVCVFIQLYIEMYVYKIVNIVTYIITKELKM